MSSRNPTNWMWAHACDLLDQAERMHRQFFQLAASGQTQAIWEPPVDVFEDEREIIVIVALPGVPAERVEIAIESGTLVVRETPHPVCRLWPRDTAARDSVRIFRAAHPIAGSPA